MMNKTDYQKMLFEIIDPLTRHFTPDGSGLSLGASSAGYGHKVSRLEGFCRVLWGLVPYWAGGGEDESLLHVYLSGITAGCDPNSLSYWGDLHDKDQRMVEMAALSYGILLVPGKLWDPLKEKTKHHLSDWLYQINLHSQADNNWHFFKVIVNLALKSVGMRWSPEEVGKAMKSYESFYIGNGWYSDGKRPEKDYYTAFAMHFYCLLYAHFAGDDDPEHARLYRERAMTFAKSFIYWFDEEGKALPFGRSMTSRFAQAAFFSVCALTGTQCFSWGIIKGILARHLDYWMRQPIFDNGGVLTVGYTYPNLLMSEDYCAPGTPYWALKTFAFLALPDTHPFWQAEEEPLPALSPIHAVRECDMLFCHRPHEVSVLTAGQYPLMNHPQAAEKYAKFAYSSVFGFCIARSYHCLEQAGTDNMLAFHVHDMFYVRRRCLEHYVTEQEVYAKWCPVDGIEVETWLTPIAGGHKRRHRIASNIYCTAYDCGFSYPDCMEETHESAEGSTATIWDENGESRISASQGQAIVIHSFSNMNLIFPTVRYPAVVLDISPGITETESIVSASFTEKEIVIGGGNCYALRG